MKSQLRKILRERLKQLSFEDLILRSGALSERFQNWLGRPEVLKNIQNKAIINFFPFGFEPQIQIEPTTPGASVPYEIGYVRIDQWEQRLMSPRWARRDVPELWEEYQLPSSTILFQPRVDQKIIETDQIAVVMVPGLGFSKDGRRLGRGAGFYDRFLSQMPQALRVGIAFEEQIVETVPTETHDQTIDLLFTDQSRIETIRYQTWLNQGTIERT